MPRHCKSLYVDVNILQLWLLLSVVFPTSHDNVAIIILYHFACTMYSLSRSASSDPTWRETCIAPPQSLHVFRGSQQGSQHGNRDKGEQPSPRGSAGLVGVHRRPAAAATPSSAAFFFQPGIHQRTLVNEMDIDGRHSLAIYYHPP